MAATMMKLTAAHEWRTTVRHIGQTSYFAGTTLREPVDRGITNAEDSNNLRPEWRMAQETATHPGKDHWPVT